MIISRAPMRLTFGGGGTDLPNFYKEYGGFVINGAINKYVYVGVNHNFHIPYLLKYSEKEIVDDVNKINHNLIRESLKLLDVEPYIEITSISDIPSKTGLASSAAFLISLLNSLCEYEGYDVIKRILVKNACHIELDILNENEGKQDKYASTFGGLKAYEFHKNGNVSIIRLKDEDLILSELQKKLHLFYIGKIREKKASHILKEQLDKTDEMKEIKRIGIKSKKLLENLELDSYGYLLDDHWNVKKQYSTKTTNERIDSIYNKAIKLGCYGGKTIGAPGGGFMMFYHPSISKDLWSFIDEMKKIKNVKYIPYKFDNDGVKTICK